eukprot:scaffold123808_cov17-Tisochrysis_lutea.AAC.1
MACLFLCHWAHEVSMKPAEQQTAYVQHNSQVFLGDILSFNIKRYKISCCCTFSATARFLLFHRLSKAMYSNVRTETFFNS